MDIVLIRDAFVSLSVLGLVAIGTAIVLRNGPASVSPAPRFLVARNASGLALALFGFFVLLVMAQDFMGVRQRLLP